MAQELYNYIQFSERFPLPNSSDGSWAMMLLRFRKKDLLKKDKHYQLKYYSNMRYMYDVRSVVRVICLEARKEHPLPTAFYLMDTYYDAFCEILQPTQSTQSTQIEEDKTE